MTWSDPSFIPTVTHAKSIIEESFGKSSNATILFCSLAELQVAVNQEYKDKNLSPFQQQLLQHNLERIEGRFFSSTNEIWLVDGKGTNFETLIHELLHSIQQCNPHRENIVQFLTFRIVNDPNNHDIIEPATLRDWLEIEKQKGFDHIKKRIIFPGDCEEF